MKAFVMAGGFGTRIRPLTVNIPKPMLPLVTRPILEHIVKLLRKHKISDIVMLLYYHPEYVKNFFGDGSDFGVKINYIIPNKDLGTAGAVRFARDKFLDDTYLIISGDLLTDFDLSKMLDFHNRKSADVTIGLTRVDNPLQFGIVITNEDGKIVKFLEKPTWGEVFSDTINTGIYILKDEVISEIPSDEEYDFSKDLFPKLLGEKRALYGFISDSYWRDIGDPDSYRLANYDVLNGKVNIEVPGNKLDLVGRDVRIGEDVAFDRNVNFQGTIIIGSNTKIGKNCKIKLSIMGNNCIIEDGVILDGAILWDNVYLKKGTKIEKAVLMSGVYVEENVSIEEGAVIGDECRIGRDSVVKEGIKIWPRKKIEQGSVVSANLVWGEKWKKALFQGSFVKGLTNIELTPEMTTKLGSAYGSTLPRNGIVLLGRDSHPASRMLRRSFMGGLASTGVQVKDAQNIPIPVLRYKLQSFGEIGGVYFKQSPTEPASTEICFYDNSGIDISGSLAKSIERIYYREDFRRAHHYEVGSISFETRLWDFYEEGFEKSLNVELIRKRQFRIVLDLSNGTTAPRFLYMLEDLVDDIVALNSYSDYRKISKSEEVIGKRLQELGKIVKSLKFDVGFYLYPNGEKIIVVDNKGKVIEGIDLLVFVSMLSLNYEEGGIIGVPPYTPTVVFEEGKRRGYEVRVVATNPRIMAQEAKSGDVKLVASGHGAFIFPDFQIAEDGMFAIGRILEMLAGIDTDVHSFNNSIGRPYFLHDKISCPWDKKGTVMRKLSEIAHNKEAMFLDGIKIMYEDSWVMIHPDEFEPYFHVFVEASDIRRGEMLHKEYVEKIKRWIR